MLSIQVDVEAFHKKFGQPSPDGPTNPGEAQIELRKRLISEEFAEVMEAIKANNLIQIAGELADLIYVTIGTATTYGIDLEPIWDAIHSANMQKERVPGSDNSVKIRKPAGWKPADIESLILDQVAEAQTY